MSVTLSEKLDGFLRFCVPYCLIFILFTLNVVSFSTPLSTKIEIPFIMMFIYYWSVYRPTLIPPLVTFFIGGYFDLIAGLPLGLSAFTLLLMRQIITEQRIFLTGQSFGVIWLVFTCVCVVALGIQWGLYGLIHWRWTPYQPVVLMILSGICFFPVISLLLNLSHRALPAHLKQYGMAK